MVMSKGCEGRWLSHTQVLLSFLSFFFFFISYLILAALCSLQSPSATSSSSCVLCNIKLWFTVENILCCFPLVNPKESVILYNWPVLFPFPYEISHQNLPLLIFLYLRHSLFILSITFLCYFDLHTPELNLIFSPLYNPINSLTNLLFNSQNRSHLNLFFFFL